MQEDCLPNLKIAIVGPFAFDPEKITGGIEAVCNNLVSGLKEIDSLEIHIITVDFPSDAETTNLAAIKVPGITVHRHHGRKRFGQLTFYKYERQWIVDKIAEIHPDMVHVHGTDMYGIAVTNINIPTVVTVHSVWATEAVVVDKQASVPSQIYQRLKGYVNARFEVKTLKAINNVIIISPYVQTILEKQLLNQREIECINNPISDAYFNLQNREIENRILFAGMIRPRKGIHHLLKAITKVKRQIPLVQLHLAGKTLDQEYMNRLQHYICEHNLEQNVSFLGLISEADLLREFEECALVATASEEEVSPLLIQQAMAANKPVVCSNAGGIPHMFEDGKSGYLVDFGDNAEMAKKIVNLLNNPATRAAVGDQARICAQQKFKCSSIVQQTYEFYQRVASQRN